LLDAWADTSGLAERIEDRIGQNLRVQYQRIGNVPRLAHYTQRSKPQNSSQGDSVCFTDGSRQSTFGKFAKGA
jgi:hypothetical protein